MRSAKSSGPRRSGFTLLELVIVMAILVALAGIVIAKLDVLQLKAEKASAGAQIRDIARLIQTYRATTNFYPDRWDSLVDRTGGNPGVLRQPGLPGTNLGGLDPGLVGGLPTGSSTKLIMGGQLTANQARSLSRLGITTVLDHSGGQPVPYGGTTAASNLAVGFVVPNSFNVGATTGTNSADADDVFATINPADTGGQKILNTIYPTPGAQAVVPSDRVLVVFGLGRYCTIVGSNLQSANLSEPPVYPYSNAQYYDRYLAVFEAYNNGDRCRLVAVLGADGDLAADEIADFNKN
jgi:prepilin-type N-terminal cleavage/methylation domain-containing protein